jgi:acetyl-CoA C-acetyltransferase
MPDIIIAGIGQTPVGEHWDISLRSLAAQAIQAAIQDSSGLKPQALFVGNMLAANLSRQAHLGVWLASKPRRSRLEVLPAERPCDRAIWPSPAAWWM